MPFRSFPKVCDEFSKIKNLRCTFFLFFHAGHQGICLFDPRVRRTLELGGVDHFAPLTFCRGLLEKVWILWLPSIINRFFSDNLHLKVSHKSLLRFSITKHTATITDTTDPHWGQTSPEGKWQLNKEIFIQRVNGLYIFHLLSSFVLSSILCICLLILES